MQAVLELTSVRKKISGKITALQAELTAIDRAIEILERETPSQPDSAVNGAAAALFKKIGLGDGCLSIVGSDFMKPSTVRDRLLAGGYKAKNARMFLGSVHSTLKRLSSLGKVELGTLDGKQAFRKASAMRRENTMNAS